MAAGRVARGETAILSLGSSIRAVFFGRRGSAVPRCAWKRVGLTCRCKTATRAGRVSSVCMHLHSISARYLTRDRGPEVLAESKRSGDGSLSEEL